ncbi:hypothetical protein AAKU55_001184 [Oxalobacteraceae bacterium GrIS 1.11]
MRSQIIERMLRNQRSFDQMEAALLADLTLLRASRSAQELQASAHRVAGSMSVLRQEQVAAMALALQNQAGLAQEWRADFAFAIAALDAAVLAWLEVARKVEKI